MPSAQKNIEIILTSEEFQLYLNTLQENIDILDYFQELFRDRTRRFKMKTLSKKNRSCLSYLMHIKNKEP